MMTSCSWLFAGLVLFVAKQMPNEAAFLLEGGLKRQLEAPAFEIRWQTELLSLSAWYFVQDEGSRRRALCPASCLLLAELSPASSWGWGQGAAPKP